MFQVSINNPLLNYENDDKEVYVIGDIHNEATIFKRLLKRIDFKINSEYQHLILLGDLFDRGYHPDPVLIHKLIKDACNISVCLGNHDIWLYNKIISHIEGNASQHLMLGGWCIESEIIDTFNAFRKEYSDIDLHDLAMMINEFNRQIEIHMPNGKKFLTAHSQCHYPVEGTRDYKEYCFTDYDYQYFKNGIEDFVCINGHFVTNQARWMYGFEQIKPFEILTNNINNVYYIDCGSGLNRQSGARLAAIRLNDMKVFYQ
ncbi:MAG: metallophosphoesterase [Lachnospira sp.]